MLFRSPMNKAKPFTLQNQNDETVSLDDYKGKYVVLYFYPKDNTPGCTVEAKDFSCLKEEFAQLNCAIIGVSKDSIAKHQNFIAKQELTIDLLSDPENEIIESYGAWQLKKNYGKEYMGIVRSTYLIAPDGNILQEWTKVRVKGHVAAVLKAVKEAQA